jgi:hypothetical protein
MILLAALSLGAVSSAVAGQDWFVRAGSDGGDGSQSKPFNDPWQALEKCQAGDRIHLAEGRYFGRLGIGMWEIPFDRLELLGGYTADFSERNPWAHPSQLLWEKDSKNRPSEARLLVRGKEVVIDGITIDMRSHNEYVDPQESGRKERTHPRIPGTAHATAAHTPRPRRALRAQLSAAAERDEELHFSACSQACAQALPCHPHRRGVRFSTADARPPERAPPPALEVVQHLE